MARVPEWTPPMLARPDGGRLRSGSVWAYELKLDGYRAAMRVAATGATILTSRNGIDLTPEFRTLAGVLTDALDGRAAVLDGEIVACDESGHAEFGLLQERRGRFRRHHTAGRDEPFADVEVRFVAFDLLRLGRRDLADLPYDERRAALAALPMPEPELVSVVPAHTFDELADAGRTPADLLAEVAGQGHEGLIAKVRGAPYLSGQRPDYWLKHPLVQNREVIVCGWNPGQGRNTGSLGGLLLGGYDPDSGALVYLGGVGTGFTERERDDLLVRLRPLRRPGHPFAAEPPREEVRGAQWTEPVLVGEVRYRQFTRGAGRLRHTSWRGLRADRAPAEVQAPVALPPAAAPEPPAPATSRVVVRAGNRRLTLSNLEKKLYPDGTSKAEVIDYYSRIAPVLLPHLAGRPVTFLRFPDGVGGESFFEKNAPAHRPEWIETLRLTGDSRRGGEQVTYPLLDDLPALVWAANLAALELHVPQWTVDGRGVRRPPDRLVFDLDPGPGAGIVECARVAERLRAALVADGLAPVAKTSGRKGMQLYAGISTTDPAAPSVYAKGLAERLAAETPDAVTARMTKAVRAGRVFVDWSQNNPAKTTIAPYSLRGQDRPTASTPLGWAEVESCRRTADLTFTAADVLTRVAAHGDLCAALLTERPPLPTG